MSKLKLVSLLCCFFLSASTGLRVGSLLNAQRSIIHYNTLNGLPHDLTYEIIQDQKGYIWVGTDNGVVRFDGQDFEIINTDQGLKTNYIISICEDTLRDRMIFASWGGGLEMMQDGKVVDLDIPGDSIAKINNCRLLNGHVLARTKAKNILYEKDQTGFIKKEMWMDHQPHDQLSIEAYGIPSKQHNGYFDVLEKELIYYNGHTGLSQPGYHFKGITKVNEDHSLERVFPFLADKEINSFSILETNYYAATAKDSVFLFDRVYIRMRAKPDLSEEEITKVILMEEDVLCILGRDVKGFKNAYLYYIRSGLTIPITDISKSTANVSDIMKDSEGNLWITTYGDGIFCYLWEESKHGYLDKDVLPETLIQDLISIDSHTYVLTPNYLIQTISHQPVRQFEISGFGKSLSVIQDTLMVNSVDQPYPPQKRRFFKEHEALFSKELEPYGPVTFDRNVYFHRSKQRIVNTTKTIYDAVFYRDTLWLGTITGT